MSQLGVGVGVGIPGLIDDLMQLSSEFRCSDGGFCFQKKSVKVAHKADTSCIHIASVSQ